MRALWLASWYPDKVDAYNGDFVQRHAFAASLYCEIDVIHVQPDFDGLVADGEIECTRQNQNLHETVAYLRMSKRFWMKPMNQLRYFRLFKRLLERYINEKGKPDIVHVHVPIKAGQMALYLKRKYNIPFVVTEHWAIYNHHAPGKFSSQSAWFRLLTKKVLSESANFFPVSNELGTAVNKMVVPKTYKVIPNVVDTGLFSYKEKKDPKPFVFLHASTLNYQKNPEAIIETFIRLNQKYPDTELRILGEVPPQLQLYLEKKTLPPAVIFEGMVSYKEVAGHMQQSDCLLLFSRYENLPCVILESFCCGVPVISTGVGGIPEVINKDNGLIVPNDTNALYEAMEHMVLQKSKYNRPAIAEAASNQFSYETVGKTILYEYCVVKLREKEGELKR